MQQPHTPSDTANCSGFSTGSGSEKGGYGNAGETSSAWFDSGPYSCDETIKLYCAEQIVPPSVQ